MKPRPQTLAGRLIEFSRMSYEDRAMANLNQLIEAHHAEGQLSPQRQRAYALVKSQFVGRKGPIPDDENHYGLAITQVTRAVENIDRYAQAIERVPPLILDPKVVESVGKMQKTPTSSILELFDLIRPPFPELWLEFHDPKKKAQYGFLVKHNDKSQAFTLKCIEWPDIYKRYPRVALFDDQITVSKDSTELSVRPETHLAPATDYEERLYNSNPEWKVRRERDIADSMAITQGVLKDAAEVAMRAFLLMNSRSKILRTEPAVRHRGPLNYIEPIALSPVKFDYSRVFKKYPGITEKQAEQLMNEQMVRGHIKVRPTGVARGVHFWSPHIRNMQAGSTPEEAWSRQLARPREDVIRHPERELVTPQGLSLPPAIP